MTYISRKTRLLMPRWLDECDPSYLYHLYKKRSDGRLKRHESCDDLRAWVDDQYLNYQYLLELMTDGEFNGRPHLGIMGRVIPVERLLSILCGDELEGSEEQHGRDDPVASRLETLRDQSRALNKTDVPMNRAATDDILNIANAAVSKLENISHLILSGDGESYCTKDGSLNENLRLSDDVPESDGDFPESDRHREENLAEYNNVCKKISRLKQSLQIINKRKEELHARIKSSRQPMCRSSSGMTVTELYSREQQMHTKRIQKKIEKLIQVKGHILNEMCEAMKYLSELKKKLAYDAEPSCHRVCYPEEENLKERRGSSCVRENNDNDPKNVEMDGALVKSSQRKKRDVERCESLTSSLNGSSVENSAEKPRQHELDDGETETVYFDVNRRNAGSFEGVLALPITEPESQNTQQISATSDRKSKSESTVNDLAHILRTYEKRLNNLGHLEVQIQELKRRACMAGYFKKRWLRCTTRGRAQKVAERTKMKEEMKHLCMENNELRKFLMTLTAKSEKEQSEIKYLKSKHKEMSEMEDEMTALRNDLKEYQLSFETQRECISSLENTVTMQRDRIENLMSHIRRLSGAAETARDTGKISKKYPRSRSHGSECKKNFRKALVPSSEESLQNPFGCFCCNCAHSSEATNRPRSECARRRTHGDNLGRR